MAVKKKTRKKRDHLISWKDPENPADGSRLSVPDRVRQAEEIIQFAEKINPYPRYRPFVKTFKSIRDYEKWKKQQTNPWLV